MIFAYSSHGAPGSWGILTTFECEYNHNYRFQLHATGYNNALYYRSRSVDRGGWTDWTRVMDSENVNGGSATQPVYFSNGVPILCTGVAKKFIQEYAAGDLADGSHTLTHGLATSYPFLVIHYATSSSTVWQPFTLNTSSSHIRFTVTDSSTITLDVSGVSNYKVRIMVLG